MILVTSITQVQANWFLVVKDIQIVKERIRAAHHQLPLKRMTRVMLQVLVMDSMEKLNCFELKGST
jgi:hypothetical protein